MNTIIQLDHTALKTISKPNLTGSFWKIYYYYYYTLHSPFVFSLAESLQLILGNSATYRLFTNL